MKNYFIMVLHLVGLVLGYICLGVIMQWAFTITFPLPGVFVHGYVAGVIIIIMPAISFACIRYGKEDVVNRVLGYTYLVLWIGTMLISLHMIFFFKR